MFSRLIAMIRGWLSKLIPYRDIEQAERIETPLSTEMTAALDLWQNMYLNKAPWLADPDMKSQNLAALICNKMAKRTLLEMKWNITGKIKNGEPLDDDNSKLLKSETQKMFDNLRLKLEQAFAAGGMVVKPFMADGHYYFDYVMDWSMYPVSFDSAGNLADVIFRDKFQEGNVTYTRLERHIMNGDNVIIRQQAFKSNNPNTLGNPVNLTDVPRWAHLKDETEIKDTEGPMFGWFRVAAANSVDIDGPMGVSVFHNAKDLIRDADEQYSRLLWEYEGSELAVDVDITALRPNQYGQLEMPKHAKRLFRGINIENGAGGDFYSVFSPPIRDASLLNGLYEIKSAIEDQVGFSHGALTRKDTPAVTATAIMSSEQDDYETLADNQAALERCIRDVVRALNKYISLDKNEPAKAYEMSITWDDSILEDTEQEMNRDMRMVDAGLMGEVEFRVKHFGETPTKAQAALEEIIKWNAKKTESRMPKLPDYK